MKTPTEEALRTLSYSELRKLAKSSGIKRRMKTNEYIAEILKKEEVSDDSFVAIERDIVNSCKKEKEKMFDKDKETPSETPRRETYTVETGGLVAESASPLFNAQTSSNKKHQRKVSFLTPVRKSVRLQNSAIKERQKTPIQRKSSLSEFVTEEPSVIQDNLPGKIETPLASVGTPLNPGDNNKKNLTNSKVKKTPNFNKIHQKAFERMESIDDYQKRKTENSTKKIKQQSRYPKPLNSSDKNVLKNKSSGIPKRFGGVPFVPSVTHVQRIETNFAAMTSREKKKTPAGVAMKPFNQRLSSSKLKNSSCRTKKNATFKQKVSHLKGNNTPNTKSPAVKKRTPFDLKASLSRKLSYKPHVGPLKPLNIIFNSNETSEKKIVGIKKNSRILNVKKVVTNTRKENAVVKAKRVESRSFLKGVRTNKRFELQMKKRLNAQ